MVDRFARLDSWITERVAAYASATVIYRRGGDSAEIAATVGDRDEQTRETLIAQGQGEVDSRERYWLIAAAELVLGGVATTPIEGDEIVETVEGRSVVWRVNPRVPTPAARASDPSRTAYRVRTILVSG